MLTRAPTTSLAIDSKDYCNVVGRIKDMLLVLATSSRSVIELPGRRNIRGMFYSTGGVAGGQSEFSPYQGCIAGEAPKRRRHIETGSTQAARRPPMQAGNFGEPAAWEYAATRSNGCVFQQWCAKAGSALSSPTPCQINRFNACAGRFLTALPTSTAMVGT
jgi:hypothetical protein